MAPIDVGCLLLGFGLLMQVSGSADFASFRTAAVHLSSSHQAVAFVLFFLGFGIKAGVIPFHIWLPAAHPVAPSNISSLLSGIVLKAGIYGMARIFLDGLGVLPSWAGLLVLIVGVASAVLGVLYALMEHDLKRLLAYHSIENIGIILIGLGAALVFRVAEHPQLAAIALLALPRSAESRSAHEAPRSMLVGMGWLAASCVALGLGATWFLPLFDTMNEQLLGARVGTNLIAAPGWVLSAGTPHGGMVSTSVIAIALLFLLIPALHVVSIAARRFVRRRVPASDCGL